MNDTTASDKSVFEVPKSWVRMGTVVGNTSTGSFTFILRRLQGKLGDIVATKVEVPDVGGGHSVVATVWGRITKIGRFNPFFPAEAAQELADHNTNFLDTVLSGSRDHLEAEVLILGTTFGNDPGAAEISPLTYPVRPSAEVYYPSASDVQLLLTGKEPESASNAKLHIGTLIARSDVDVAISAKHVVARHLAILAMTGGGKTVAARRVIRELIDLGYPLVIFDPHGDYLGFYEKRAKFPKTRISVFYPMIRIRKDNIGIISDLIHKMGRKLTEAQQQFFTYLLSDTPVQDGQTATRYLERLVDHADAVSASKRKKEAHLPDEVQAMMGSTINATKRSLEFVLNNLRQMEGNNARLRDQERFKGYEFDEMPDPHDAPEEIISKNAVSIFYLAGYDHLNQSAIVSIVLEALFHHRATLSGMIPPFQAIIEEAHNFVPSHREGTDETPSLVTIRKLITEGRKFGTGLTLISQRPSRLDETTLSQCNSFLVLRLVNPQDKRFVRSVMENLSEDDAGILQTFGPGQGIVSGQAVRFPLLVKIKWDADLQSEALGKEDDFISDAQAWEPKRDRKKASETVQRNLQPAAQTEVKKEVKGARGVTRKLVRRGRRGGGIKPQV